MIAAMNQQSNSSFFQASAEMSRVELKHDGVMLIQKHDSIRHFP